MPHNGIGHSDHHQGSHQKVQHRLWQLDYVSWRWCVFLIKRVHVLNQILERMSSFVSVVEAIHKSQCRGLFTDDLLFHSVLERILYRDYQGLLPVRTSFLPSQLKVCPVHQHHFGVLLHNLFNIILLIYDIA